MKNRVWVLSLMALALGACCSHGKMEAQGGGGHMAMMHHENMWASVNRAVAVIYPTKGNSASGTITFTKAGDDAVRVEGTITGLQPNSTHAIHIHEYGDQSSDNGMSAGGHYNPEGHKHGGPNSPQHHAGDLGNVVADSSGTARIEETVDGITIAGMRDPIIGRSVVIHERPDDFVSQPVGNAGGRIGVGVIGIAKGEEASSR